MIEMTINCENTGQSCIQRWSTPGKGEPCKCGKCDVCVIFGCHDPQKSFIPRVIFTDAYLVNKEKIESINEGMLTELKIENRIHRITGTARDPRKNERVPPGAIFEGEIKYLVLDSYRYDNQGQRKQLKIKYKEKEGDTEIERELAVPSDVLQNGSLDKQTVENRLKIIFKGMKLVEETYLGGSGTRGYGKIAFCDVKVEKQNIAGDIPKIDVPHEYEKFKKSPRERIQEGPKYVPEYVLD